LPTILILLLGLVLALRAGFDSDLVKARLIAQVRQETRRELAIDGSLRLRFLPRLAVEADAIQLSSVNGKDAFLTLDKLTGAIKIVPLLRGRVVVNRIELRNLRIQAVRYADGSTNFDDFLIKRGATETPWKIDVEKAVLLDSSLSWRDEMTGRRLELENLYLRTGHLGKQARGKLEMGGHIRDASGEARANVIATSLYWINGKETFLQLENPHVTVKGEGSSAPFHLELNARRARGTVGHAAALELAQLALTGEATRDDGTWRTAIQLADLQVNTRGGFLRGLTAEARQVREEDTVAIARLALATLTGRNHVWRGTLLVNGNGSLAGHAISGRMTIPLEFMPGRESSRLSSADLTGAATIQQGERLARTIDIRAQGGLTVTQTAPENVLQAEGRVDLAWDASRLETGWRLDRLDPLRLEFDASLDTLNLDRYLKQAGNASDKSAKVFPAEGTQPASPGSSAENSGIFLPEIRGHIRIGQLEFKGTRLSGIEGNVRVRDGRLEIDDLEESPRDKPVRKKRKTRR
jgi:hypothetical protein